MSDLFDASATPRHPSRSMPMGIEVPRGTRRFGDSIRGGMHSRSALAGQRPADSAADGRSFAHRSADAPLRCLLTTLSPESALSRALVQHLTAEMPGIQFRLRLPHGAAEPEAVWICGYRAGHAHLVHQLRALHPHAALIVTGRGPIEAWENEVLRAGADSACTWPLPYDRLAGLLRQGREAARQRQR